MTTVHTQPDYGVRATAPAPPGYPTIAQPDHFSTQPFAPTFAARRAAFFEHVRRNPAPNNLKAIYYELARLAAGDTPHPGILHGSLDFIDARKDCADFVLHAVLRLLYSFSDHPALAPDFLERAQQTVLNFKYWPDEPGVDSLCTWTENHHILFASAAYLAGQMFPTATFPNSGHTGVEKMALNRPRILRWLDLRFHTGFSEWLSHVYYDEDLTALLGLVDFCQDEEVRRRAVQVTDLLLLDIALNSFQGVFGSSHGRAYTNTKKWASNEGTTDAAKLLFGSGIFSAFDNMSAVPVALSKYRMPAVLEAIANDRQRPEMLNRQRMGIRINEAERWGLGFDSLEDGMVFLTLEAYLHPRTAGLTLRMFDQFNWWQNSFFAPFQEYRGLIGALRRTGLMRPLARALEWDLCRNTREEVNLYTYRTPDYMLNTAQDYRPGYGGDQQHIWQATLGPNAVCFTTHPGRLNGPTPDAWAGSGVLPRAAQIKNVVIIVYHTRRRPALYVPIRNFYTHAWLPQDQFDEFIEQQGWFFARKDDGYLALTSRNPCRWQQAGEDAGRELIADGGDNIWICELGCRAQDGEFSAFIKRITAAQLDFDGLKVVYASPTQGQLSFGWQGELRQDEQVIPLHDYPRYDNPYSQAGFAAETIDVQLGKEQLHLGWPDATRQASRLLAAD